eukprot:1155989-Pelagomonas_calceolata.AAC.2
MHRWPGRADACSCAALKHVRHATIHYLQCGPVLRKEHHQAIEEFVATQFLFDKQWMALRAYANDLGIKIIGDMPIYVGGHSVDVWAHQELFELGPDGHPTTVSGVPPDAFSETGECCLSWVQMATPLLSVVCPPMLSQRQVSAAAGGRLLLALSTAVFVVLAQQSVACGQMAALPQSVGYPLFLPCGDG